MRPAHDRRTHGEPHFPGLSLPVGTGGDDSAKPLIAAIPFLLGLFQGVIDITHFLSQSSSLTDPYQAARIKATAARTVRRVIATRHRVSLSVR